MDAQEPIYGCMDNTAYNFNSEATVHDGTCKYYTTVGLQKNMYGHKTFEENIDINFKEIKLRDYQIADFFALYKKVFYNIDKNGLFSHKTIIDKSTDYIPGYINPKTIQIWAKILGVEE